jgi:hypothetical protein
LKTNKGLRFKTRVFLFQELQNDQIIAVDNFGAGVVAEQVSNIPGLGSFNRLDFGGGVIGDAAAKFAAFRIANIHDVTALENAVNLDDAGGQETAIFLFQGQSGPVIDG